MQKENAPPLIESGEAQDVSEASATTFCAPSSNKASENLESPHSNFTAAIVEPRTTKRRHAAAAKVDALAAFRLRCEVRAWLVVEGELDLQTAVDELQASAVKSSIIDVIGQDAVQAIMATAFAKVRGQP
jgi:hypothetical protein